MLLNTEAPPSGENEVHRKLDPDFLLLVRWYISPIAVFELLTEIRFGRYWGAPGRENYFNRKPDFGCLL